MPVLKDKDREEVRKALAAVEQPVRLVMFTQEIECDYCGLTRELLEEVSGLSDRLTLEVHDLVRDVDLVRRFGLAEDRVPALVIMGEEDYGIRFYGVPSGYEFMTLIDDVVAVGRRRHGLSAEVMDELAKVDQKVHIQVMVTPS